MPADPVPAAAPRSAPSQPVHLVGVTIHSSFPAPADLEALMAFALPNAIEFVAVGVNSRNDVNAIRSFLDDNGGESIKLVRAPEGAAKHVLFHGSLPAGAGYHSRWALTMSTSNLRCVRNPLPLAIPPTTDCQD